MGIPDHARRAGLRARAQWWRPALDARGSAPLARHPRRLTIIPACVATCPVSLTMVVDAEEDGTQAVAKLEPLRTLFSCSSGSTLFKKTQKTQPWIIAGATSEAMGVGMNVDVAASVNVAAAVTTDVVVDANFVGVHVIANVAVDTAVALAAVVGVTPWLRAGKPWLLTRP